LDRYGAAAALRPLGVVQLSNDDAQGALDAALEHFAELARVLDDASAKATKVNDLAMVEGLARAKAAATRGTGLVAELRDILASRGDGEHASAA
jgi:hypothetical protein